MTWESSIGTMKGLDFRDARSQCHSIHEYALGRIWSQREDAVRIRVYSHPDAWPATLDGKTNFTFADLVRADLKNTPPTAQEREDAVARGAAVAYGQGYLLLAVAPDLEADTAAELLAKVYAATRRRHAKPKQRARWEDWLPLISSFEDAVATGTAYAQQFARYRRVLDSIRFAQDPPASVTTTIP